MTYKFKEYPRWYIVKRKYYTVYRPQRRAVASSIKTLKEAKKHLKTHFKISPDGSDFDWKIINLGM